MECDMSTDKTIEEELAVLQNKNLQDSLIAERTRYIALTVVFVLLAIGIVFTGFWMVALASFVLGLIFLSQYFDANGHLHEVQRRSTKSLVRDFSVLQRADRDSSNKPQSASH
jgi:Flp pilus assembly protein TadB